MMSSNSQISTEPVLSAKEPEDKEQAPVATEATPETCLNNSGLMIALAVIMVSLLVPVGILAQKIKNLKNDVPTSEMAKFESTQSAKKLNIKPEDSVEANLKVNEENK